MNVKIDVPRPSAGLSTCALKKFCQRRGIATDAAFDICNLLGLNCTFSSYNSDYGDVDESGNGTGMIGAIQRGEFDTSIPVFSPTYRRMKSIAFSDTLFYADIFLVAKTPSATSANLDWTILGAFQWQTWFAFLISLAIMIIVISLVAKKFTFEIEIKKFTRDSIRVLLIAWAFALLVLSSAYTGALFSDKVIKPSNLPFTDLETFARCLEEERCRMITPTLSSTFLQVLAGNESEVGRRIRATWETRPLSLETISEIPKLILQEQKVALVWLTSAPTFDVIVGDNRNCEFYLVETPYKDPWSFPVRKNSSLLPLFNKMAASFRENGLAQVFEKKYSPMKNAKCSTNGNTTQQSDLRSVNLTVIYFYGLGMIVSLFGFGMELFVYCTLRRLEIGLLDFLGKFQYL